MNAALVLSPDEKSSSHVLLAETEGERRRIFQMRYQIYVNEMGKQPDDADHNKHLIWDDLDKDAFLFYMTDHKGEIIATLRANLGRDTMIPDQHQAFYALEQFKPFRLEDMAFASRLMVSPKWRRSPALGKLLSSGYQFAREQGIQFQFCHCTPALVPFYETLGFRRYTDNFVVPNLGYRVPLVLILEDIEHLRNTRSPFLRLARKRPNHQTAFKVFSSQFPNHTRHINTRLVPQDQFWSLLGEKLEEDPQQKIPLFHGMPQSEAQMFLKAASVISCQAGQVLIQPGEVGQEMFVVLSGVVEIQDRHGTRKISLASLGPGQIFGEIEFISSTPRSTWVVATSDLELLVLTPFFLQRMMRNMPSITVKILFNLATELCDRLRMRTMEQLCHTSVTFTKNVMALLEKSH